MSFSVVLHHGGKFLFKAGLDYFGGSESVVEEQDVDRWSYFEALGIVKDLGFGSVARIWWKKDNKGHFRRFRSDQDASDLATFAMKFKVSAHLYIEHNEQPGHLQVNEDRNAETTEVNDEVNDEETDEESEDELKGIHMDESEEERTHGKEDGFGDVETLPAAAIGPSQASIGSPTSPNTQPTTLPPQTTPGGSRILINGTYYRVKSKSKRTPKKRNDPSTSGPAEDLGELSDGYVTVELHSSDPDEDGEGGGSSVRYDRFKPHELNKDYQFKVGLEFGTLDEFREAIREWFILNGWEVEFDKNESYGVRVICKQKCGFVALVSKVSHSETFRMKTWHGTHNCGRVLNNSSARSKWVAKSVAKKLLTTDKVKINEIITDIRLNYKAGITYGRAQRARRMAIKMVEGDADKQYALLWRYAAELRRVNPGNTCKINMLRSAPDLQPRFGSFYFCFDGCKQGFLKGCRPIVCVDGCFLKTKYGGQLLVAVGRDPNDQYYPLAFGVVETETKDSWRWFLQLLLEDIGHQDRRWIFISDQQKVMNFLGFCT